MLRRLLLSLVVILNLNAVLLRAQNYQSFNPTTTVAAETSNNTSAASEFPGCESSSVTHGQCWQNGNLKASNVSKVNLHTLLSPSHQGAKILTTYIPYWGNKSHPNIGYSSIDPDQVAREVSDLVSRGFDGVLMDWYGPGSWEDRAAQVFKPAAEKTSLAFSIMIDQGAIEWHSCYPSCSATQALLNTIGFARQQGYFSSLSALRDTAGKTLVTQFGLERYDIDWKAILSANSDLRWVFENAGGFTNPYAVGAYGWLSPKSPLQPGYEGLDYTQYFEKVASSSQSRLNWSSAWKGFNDIVASWAPPGGRHIEQGCGHTWLDSWSAVRAYGGRLDAVQVVTWHDYEEGTEIQSGIDNCQTVSAKVSGSILSWTILDDATVDHYTVYISTDGKRLMSLGEFAVGISSLDLSKFNFAPANYLVFVKAVGKPSIVNQMSGAALYTVRAAFEPTVTITAPYNNQLAGPYTDLKAGASSKNGAITQYSIVVDGNVVQTLPGAKSFQYWTPTPMGVHNISVLAYDVLGHHASAEVTIKRVW